MSSIETGRKIEKTAEDKLQEAFMVYAQGVDQADLYSGYAAASGFATERSIHKANLEALFRTSGLLAREAYREEPEL